MPRSRFAPVNEATNASAGPVDELARGRELAERAVDDHADLVGERGRVLEVVRDEDRRQRELAQQLLQLGAHRALRVRVERGERLVEQEHARVAGERARERDALALAAGERGRAARRRGGRCGSARGSSSARALPRVGDVLADGQVREERVLLEDEPDAALVRLAEEPRARCRARRRRRARSGPRGGRTSPAIARSTEVLPGTRRPDEGDGAARPRALARARKSEAGA